MPAGDVEALVGDRIRTLLSSPSELGDIIAPLEFEAQVQRSLLSCAKEVAAGWPELPSVEMRALLRTAIDQVIVDGNGIVLHLKRSGILDILNPDIAADACDAGSTPFGDDTIVLEIEAQLARLGKGVRLIIGDATRDKADPELENLLRECFAIRDQLFSGNHDSIESMSKRLGLPKGHLTSRIRLTWLAPDLAAGILNGRHPVELTRAQLLSKSADLPHDWSQQREFLGFPAA